MINVGLPKILDFLANSTEFRETGSSGFPHGGVSCLQAQSPVVPPPEAPPGEELGDLLLGAAGHLGDGDQGGQGEEAAQPVEEEDVEAAHRVKH